MSEYQWVHFIAVDEPVSDSNLEFMHAQSSRANVSRWEFTNEYNFGSFRGNADEMLRRGYDVLFHFANYGIRHLQFRLPELPCDRKMFSRFAIEHEIEWQKDARGKAGILTISPESDGGSWDYLMKPESYAHRLAPLRVMLLNGDLRPLYLAWLATCHDESRIEPPVPAGLNDTHDALEAIAELYEMPHAMLERAAENSAALPAPGDREVLIEQWLKKQKKAELHDCLRTVLLGGVEQHRRLLNEICRNADRMNDLLTPGTRTFGELSS